MKGLIKYKKTRSNITYVTTKTRPIPPKIRYHCNVCGYIENGKHTNIICKMIIWLESVLKRIAV